MTLTKIKQFKLAMLCDFPQSVKLGEGSGWAS
jgi:hypothetical protein